MPHLARPVPVTIEYKDATGNETTRRVDVTRTAKESRYFRITGFCHYKEEERSFRSDRTQCIITEDGEVISADEFVDRVTNSHGVVAPRERVSSPKTSRQHPVKAESAETTKPKPQPQRRFGWGSALFAIAIAPAVIIAIGFLVAENDPGTALGALLTLGAPVLLVRWLWRKLRGRKQA